MPLTGPFSAADVMSRYQPASAPTWAELIWLWLADPIQAERIGLLRAELERGPFRWPVRVDDEEMSICDGQHRLIAAYLSGAELSLMHDYPERGYRYWTVLIRVGRQHDDLVPLQSLRLDDRGWAEPTGASTNGNGIWDLEYGMPEQYPPDVLRERLQHFLTRHGTDGEVISVEPAPELDESELDALLVPLGAGDEDRR